MSDDLKKPAVIVVGNDSTAEALKQSLRRAGMDPDTHTATGRRLLLVDSFSARYGLRGVDLLSAALAMQVQPLESDFRALERRLYADMQPPVPTYTTKHRKGGKRKRNKYRR